MNKGKYVCAREDTPHQKSLAPAIVFLDNGKSTCYGSITSLTKSIMSVALQTEERMPIMRLWLANFLKTCHYALKALSKIRIGKKMASIPVGLALLMSSID